MKKILILDNNDSFSHNLRHLLRMGGKHQVDVWPTSDYSPAVCTAETGKSSASKPPDAKSQNNHAAIQTAAPERMVSIEIPKTSEMVDDMDCPWVITYRDKGPNRPAPGGGWPSCWALVFKDYDTARDFWDAAKENAGRSPEVGLFPLRIHTH